MTPLTVGQRLFCLSPEGEVMQTSTIERITEHYVFVHPEIGLDRADLETWGSYKIPVPGGMVWSIDAVIHQVGVVPGSMIYSRGARAEWSFTEHKVGEAYEYRQDFETMAEAEAFIDERRQEARQKGLPFGMSVSNLDGIARLLKQGMELGIIDREGNLLPDYEDPTEEEE